jgi:hypothetical protein
MVWRWWVHSLILYHFRFFSRPARGIIALDLKTVDVLAVTRLVNELYYQKFGFVLKKEITLERAEKPLKLGIMVRDPKTSIQIGSSKMKDVVTVVERML